MIVKFIRQQHWWQSARFQLQHPLSIQNVTIPVGFESDGASVPRWLPVVGVLLLAVGHWQPLFFIPGFVAVFALGLFPRFGRTINAALLHDYLLRTRPHHWRHANNLFLQQLKSDGIQRWRAYLMYFAVTVYQAITPKETSHVS